jgi:high-affinity Fe2+/Pb2+ permease
MGIFALLVTFPAMADGPIIPTEAGILMIAGVVLGGFACALLFSWLIKFILQKLRRENRKWLWIMGLTTFLSAYLFYFLEEQYDWLYYSNIELNYGYETRVKVYNFLFLLSAILGSIAGYFCLPKYHIKT